MSDLDLIYFAPVSLHSYMQRPHFMVKALLGSTYRHIYWVDPVVTRLPKPSDFSYLKKRSSDVVTEAVIPGVTVLRTRSLPVEPLPVINQINQQIFWKPLLKQLEKICSAGNCDIGIGRPSRLTVWASKHLKARTVFMDVMDDFPSFYEGLSRKMMQRSAAATAEQCDIIFFSDQTLLKKIGTLPASVRTEVIPNGYDMSRLPPVDAYQPAGMIGFVGTIAGWFDWDLVLEMANALPEVMIRLVGPCIGEKPAQLPANIEMKPACNLEQAIAYCSEFSAGLIPFQQTPLTDSVDPIKFYELRGIGVPVWTTDFGSMRGRIGMPGVIEIKKGTDWRQLWQQTQMQVLSEQEILNFRRQNDWSQRFARMHEVLC